MINGKNKKLKKMLGMRHRPTTAGQARFGNVDVAGGLMGEDMASTFRLASPLAEAMQKRRHMRNLKR